MRKSLTLGLILIFSAANMTAQEKSQRTRKAATKQVPVEVTEGAPTAPPEDLQLNVQPIQEAGNINEILPTINDVDGNAYNITALGNQTWMAENLKTTRYNDGTPITGITDNASWSSLKDPAYCWYSNNADIKDFYGALYNWYAVKTGNLCPSGWHIPTDAEWTELELFLQNSGFNYDGTVDADLERETKNRIAKALASAYNWAESTIKGSVGNTDYESFRNKTNFTALPAGCRKTGDGSFDGVTTSGFWWSSTESDAGKALIRSISENDGAVARIDSGKAGGYSVRCVKD